MNLKQNDFVINRILTDLNDEIVITIITQREQLNRC
jgi:hypothetical protein